jgi:peptidyl-tRNA hydrolase
MSSNQPDRLYIVTRADLPIGLACAQVTHAAFQFARDRWELTAPWMRDSQYVVLVTVPDESALEDLCFRASYQHLAHERWHEPDLNGQLTAVALAPSAGARKLCANLPCLGRTMAMSP